MISGISSATKGLVSAVTRVERTAAVIATKFDTDDPRNTRPAANEPKRTDLVGTQIDLMLARFQFSASLVALEASTDMLAESIKIGGYGLSADEMR